jgi:hypothetical protein
MARYRIMWTAPPATNSDETVPCCGVAACDDRVGDVLARPGGELHIPRAVDMVGLLLRHKRFSAAHTLAIWSLEPSR